ncbi:class I SAM-dependent RNA methyltransferase [Nesterenkonia flava]|uniref:TRAM domain-containing protein n=1 Tax=Nesterenkonia flava TaxID=469799 RepID=A0ABU1FV48_9MICC|nr:TRAM domain-containing protein [Nesterenkonia flava]MDR5712068.1 TRAM domain-containing protein [Nesterenkonia flava]
MTSAQMLTLQIGPMAHGGHCIARHEGRVVFVRHAVPGETVRAAVTEGGEGAKFWRADVVEVLRPSDHRRRHVWKQADALRAHELGRVPVGGADYGHITDAHQRRLKGHVFRDALARIGGIDLADMRLPGLPADGELHVEPVEPISPGGLHWRTRVSFGVTGSGGLGMKPFRSHDLVELRSMPLAVEALGESTLFSWDFQHATTVDVVAPGGAGPLALIVHVEVTEGEEADSAVAELTERLRRQAGQASGVQSITLALRHAPPASTARPPGSAGGSRAAVARRSGRRGKALGTPTPTRVEYRCIVGERTVREPLPSGFAAPEGQRESVQIAPEGFWQIHRGAPRALVSAAVEMSQVAPGDSAADLYAGAGLFTAWLAGSVGSAGHVLSVEAAGVSHEAAVELFQGVSHVHPVGQPVERTLQRLTEMPGRPRLVLLDPPRAGAGQRVIAGLDAVAPEQILYVSCDPASFARDAKQLLSLGWRLRRLRVLDMYPNTHHMESVALFTH